MRPPFARTLSALLAEQAERHGPDHPAVLDGELSLSFPALLERAGRAAAVLRAAGVARGSRVGLLVGNRVEWLEVAFGAWMLGALLVPFSTWCTEAELAFLLADSAVSVLVTLPRFGREEHGAIAARILERGTAPALRRVLSVGGGHGLADYSAARDAAAPVADDLPPGQGPSASDDAIMLYTSGSTSRPKAIALPHYLVVENGFNIGERQGLGPLDRVLLSPPLFWAYGGINALPAAFTHGAALVLQARFEAGEALDLIERHGCTSLYTLPGMTAALLAHPSFGRARTRTLRTGLTIGSPQDVVSAATALGAGEMCNIYGASECGGNCCVTPHDWPLERRARCQGPPLPGVELRIVHEETGAVLEPGHPGLVEVRGPYVMRGYAGASAVHDAAVLSPDGWFRSGDVGELTEGGEMVFHGRSTEMIKRAGINVSPAEVEDVLMQHEAVAQAGVVGVPSARGEDIVAFVVARPGAAPAPEALLLHCRRLASTYKVPDRLEVVPALPATATGKLLRRELKALAARPQGA